VTKCQQLQVVIGSGLGSLAAALLFGGDGTTFLVGWLLALAFVEWTSARRGGDEDARD
jgi:hypothetical protein